jgi:hypothetical protein
MTIRFVEASWVASLRERAASLVEEEEWEPTGEGWWWEEWEPIGEGWWWLDWEGIGKTD